MRRTLLLLPALALAAPLLTSCGEDGSGGDGTTTIEAVDLIRSSPEAMADVGTARMEMTMDVAGEELTAEGAFDFANETGTMTMDAPGPDGGTIETVFDGTVYYLGVEAFGGAIPGLDADWIRMDIGALADEMGIDLDALTAAGGANNPTSALDGLEGVSEDGIDEVGTEDVRGVSTTHYEAEIDMQAVLDQAQAQLDELDEGDLGALGDILDEDVADQFTDAYGAEPIPIEVWIDDDGLARRMTITTPVGGESGTMTMEMFDFGEPVDVEVPPAEDTVDFLELLGGFPGMDEVFGDN